MNVFEFVVVIVLIATIGRVLQMRYQAQRTQHGPANDGELIRAREEVQSLKERVQVLERVVTDNHGSQRLDSEIERLRDR